jgi:RNA polymerase sigma factor (sigma-70 family)
MNSEKELIRSCLDKDPKAQEQLYRRFAPKMYGVCLRYARSRMEAEDILQEGFIKVFNHLPDYRFEGVFEGWIRRTIVNTAINYYKQKSKEWAEISLEKAEETHSYDESIIDKLSAQELLGIIQQLPEGYRIIFNLYIIEGYTHQEIGKILNISENTSKSQLSRARAALQQKIKQRNSKT